MSESAFAVPGPWARNSNCHDPRDMEMPFGGGKPNGVVRLRLRRAREICATCTVKSPCLAWALTTPDPALGLIAGGMTPAERDRARNGSL